MNQDVDRLIHNLAPAIDSKCEELKLLRKEKLQSRLFVILCALVVIIPALLVFVGASLTALIAPIIFMSLSILLLLPVLLNGKSAEQGGISYEQA